ncbi:PDDEXK nuclease domain-containing protein [Glutamicibacter arilaitensis]|uniref:PDDEXK nuclease domain-containing protein n=1 Tax=Glutamicibacter arilaitensis TaxID=256701 RepID=UPI003F90461E
MSSNEITSSAEDVVYFESTPPAAGFPTWYPKLRETISDRVSRRQRRASLAVSQELVVTYRNVGRHNGERQTEQCWGSKVIDRLYAHLRDPFPGIKGFFPPNLKYVRSFADTWTATAIVQSPLAQLPCYHHIALLEKLDDASTRLWYARMALSEGWDRNYLVRQIETRLHERSGQTASNFDIVLSSSASFIVQKATKDPYVFDFLELTEAHNERELEAQLLEHVERFLLALGRGFAFVGRQLRLDVAGDEFFPDLIFYNFILRRFVVVELKTGKFEPCYLGQLGMYMSAADDLMAQPGDEPTIGLLLCKTKNSVVAEYALRGFSSPIGVAEWATELKDSLPENIFRSLPSIDELEAELAGAETTAPDDSSFRD